MLVLAISVAGALAVFLLLRFIVKTRLVPETQMHQRLRKLKYGSQVQVERETAKTLSDIPFFERTIAPFFRSIVESLTQFAPKGIHDQLERRIMLAGKQGVWSVAAFVCGWVVSVAVGLLLAFLFFSDADMPFIQKAALFVLGGVVAVAWLFSSKMMLVPCWSVGACIFPAGVPSEAKIIIFCPVVAVDWLLSFPMTDFSICSLVNDSISL